MIIQKFEDLIVWQKAQDFAVLVYKQFALINDFGFKNQICRASVSISNNIAEGFNRNSNLEFKRFLYISLASNSELKSMLYLAYRLEYITEKEKLLLHEYSNEIGKITNGLINSIPNKKPNT
ncbi:MAG: four helix bundle protein [Sphingobacteriales bacterium]|nr:MAG: four helix bundle protein [Sphingobacteriales bacterium]TAF78231.1 MAG: four helix bundle protein [Sphingobacteriales bacterium]